MSDKSFWDQFVDRNQRLALTLISKQWLGFYVATALLHQKLIGDQVWVLAFGIAVGANVFQKVKGLDNGVSNSNKQPVGSKVSTMVSTSTDTRTVGNSNLAENRKQDIDGDA